MRLSMMLLWVACLTGMAQEKPWEFSTPPTAVQDRVVNADWRAYGALELDVELLSPPPKGEVRCSFFFENKRNWWFESRKMLDLKKGRQRFILDLSQNSSDWHAAETCRGYAPDALRWVRRWGLKVFSRGKNTLKVRVLDLRLIPRKAVNCHVREVIVPRYVRQGETTAMRFRLSGFNGNPYDARQISLRLAIAAPDGRDKTLPVYFRQAYTAYFRPYGGRRNYRPLDEPVWQADWKPALSGKHDLTLKVTINGRTFDHALKPVDVGPPPTPQDDEVCPTGEPTLVQAYAGPPIFVAQGNDWQYPLAGTRTDAYFHAQLDWTSKWGSYTGLGEFDQENAWLLEKDIRESGAAPMPLLVFSEDELDDQGTYNWKDHPLNEMNGGPLLRPADFFTNAKARDIVLNRARYLWARYGSQPKVSGLLILVNRPQDQATQWLRDIVAKLRSEFPDIRIMSNNPGLPKRSLTVPLELYSGWRTDKRLARFTLLSTDRRRKSIVIEGRYPGTTAVLSRNAVQHWGGADVFSVDVQTSEASGNEVKAMCFLRTEPSVCYQSKLAWLREDDTNRVYFPLRDPSFWTCVTHPERKLDDSQLMNIREVALRFFCDEPNEVVLNVSNCCLLYPTDVECKNQPRFVARLRTPPPKSVGRYQKFEVDFDLNRRFRNPYDEHEIAITVHVTDPAGRTISHPGYYNEPWELKMVNGQELPARSGNGFWRIRVSPIVTGKHTWRIEAATPKGKAILKGEFTCTESKNRGFVQISKADRHYFEFSNGEYYFPIGHNLRSPSDRRPKIYQKNTLANADWADKQGTRAYENWFKKMKDNGENFTRVWMCPWWLGLEWNRETPGYHGLNYYNQQNAARLDRIIDLAEENGIYINVETANHGMFSTRIDGDWQHNPYSTLHPGGFLRYATDFFYSNRAQEMYRRKMRYTTARWGYSTAIAFWGVITETEWIEPYDRGDRWVQEKDIASSSYIPKPYRTTAHQNKAREWVIKTARYIKQSDAHPHIVTTHFSTANSGDEMWVKPEMEIVHNNAYTIMANYWWSQLKHFRLSKGVADVIYVYGNYYHQRFPNKPLLLGEWGGHPTTNTEEHLKAELHTGIWTNYMTTISGITGYWWWNLIDSNNLYSDYKAIAAFSAGEDRRGKQYRSALALVRFPKTKSTSSIYRRAGVTLYNRDELFAFIYSSRINTYKSSIRPTGFDDKRFPESGLGTLAAPRSMRDGEYKVEYWNTFTGKVIRTTTVRITSSKHEIPIINHRSDLALKLKLIKPTTPARR